MSILRRNHVVVHGDGPSTIVFAHGFACDQRVWRYVAPRFVRSHRVVLFDYVGAGHSDIGAYDSERYRSLDGYARDILEVIEALNLDRVHLVAHSVSAMIGALAAIEAPDRFDRIAMLAPSPRYLNDPPDYLGGFERTDIEALLELMDHNYLGWAKAFAQVAAPGQELAAQLQDDFCSTDPRIARQFAFATFYADQRDELPRIPVPCLVVQCSDDEIAPVSVGEYIRDHLQQPSYRLLQVSGHMPHMSNPDETAAVVSDYLRSPLVK